MALVTCPDCKKEISSSAEACPHCGRPMVHKSAKGPRVRTTEDSAWTRNRGCADLLVWGFVIILVLIFIFSMAL